jgi:hypothetical protein
MRAWWDHDVAPRLKESGADPFLSFSRDWARRLPEELVRLGLFRDLAYQLEIKRPRSVGFLGKLRHHLVSCAVRIPVSTTNPDDHPPSRAEKDAPAPGSLSRDPNPGDGTRLDPAPMLAKRGV